MTTTLFWNRYLQRRPALRRGSRRVVAATNGKATLQRDLSAKQ